jgi:hypothetical protein
MTVAESTTTKLDPAHIRVSPKFTAILAFLLGEKWTDPAITELVITSDGLLMAQVEGDIGANHIEGEWTDLQRNLIGVSDAADLDPGERLYLYAQAQRRIQDWRR